MYCSHVICNLSYELALNQNLRLYLIQSYLYMVSISHDHLYNNTLLHTLLLRCYYVVTISISFVVTTSIISITYVVIR